jgi:hypothetical protein
MTIAILPVSVTELSTYGGLVDAVGRWLKDTGLEDRITDFIALAEARFNRVLPVSARELTTTLSTTGEVLDLPADFSKARAAYLDTDPRRPLEQVSPSVLRTRYGVQTTGVPQAYALIAGQMVLGPAPDDEYDLILTYEATIPSLNSASQSNWLSVAHPDIYLYGTLVQAEAYLWNDERVTLWKVALDEAMAELIGSSNRNRYGAAPLQMRSSVIEVI